MMKSISVLASLVWLLTGCASTQYHWQKEAWAKQTEDEAHKMCTAKARVTVDKDTISVDDQATASWSDFMNDCMANYGFKLVRGTAPEPTRDTASKPEAPNG